jgi:hypothetical protein
MRERTNLPNAENIIPNKNQTFTPTPVPTQKVKEMRRINICSVPHPQPKNYCTNSIRTAKYN